MSTREQQWSPVRVAAALTRGPADLLDFVVPLWAGLALHLDAAAIGLLVAVELAVSCVARPIAGLLADRADRRGVAAIGAAVYGLGVAGYALATPDAVGVAFVAASVSGLGGSLLWVSVRAMVSEQHVADPAGFARLMAAEETGAWVAFVVGLSALGMVGYAGLFLIAALACVIGAVVLARMPRGAALAAHRSGPRRAAMRRLSPLVIAVVVSMAAEAGLGLLVLIHLQKHFELGVIETAWVFLPGAIALAVLPKALHGVVVRIGRRPAVLAAGLLSTVFAVGLVWASSPVMIGVLWVLSAAAWAVMIPVQQAAVAESVDAALFGSAMGVYEAAVLAGGAIGATLAGTAYASGSWRMACLVFAGIALLGGLTAPFALRLMGIADRPMPVAPGADGTT